MIVFVVVVVVIVLLRRSSARNLKDVLGFELIDLRDEEERTIEQNAGWSLGGVNERLAKRIVILQNRKDQNKYVVPEAREEIRKIGEYLGEHGGDSRMKKVAYRVQALGGSARLLELFWEDICGWQA
jgi:hypothetical protein